MSYYYSVVISFSSDEFDTVGDDGDVVRDCKPLVQIDAWLKKRYQEPLCDISESFLGSNAILFGGCYNKLDVTEFFEMVRKRKWRYPESLRIFYWSEEDDAFSIAWPRGEAVFKKDF